MRVSSIRPNSTNYYIGFYNALEEGYNDTKGNDWMAYERGQAAYKATIAQGQATDVSQNVGNRSHPPSLATFEARDYSGGGDGGDRWRG